MTSPLHGEGRQFESGWAHTRRKKREVRCENILYETNSIKLYLHIRNLPKMLKMIPVRFSNLFILNHDSSNRRTPRDDNNIISVYDSICWIKLFHVKETVRCRRSNRFIKQENTFLFYCNNSFFDVLVLQISEILFHK